MSTPTHRPAAGTSPGGPTGPRMPLYTNEFAADPHRVYRQLRDEYGALAPVELAPGVPATLVLDYRTALRILHDPEHFPADSRVWQRDIPADCPVLPMLQWRPSAIRSAGQEHTRYRRATVAGIDGVELYSLHDKLQPIATRLINAFCEAGTADLIGQYTQPLAFEAITTLLGCPPVIGQRAARGLAAMFDGTGADQGNLMFAEAMADLMMLKRNQPSNDITTRLLQHPAGLDNAEMIHQLTSFFGAGIEPPQNLIANTLLLMLTDTRFAGDLLGGSMRTQDAIDEVLFADPPLSNYCISFPPHPVLIDETWLPAHQPVVISIAGCNNDPRIATDGIASNSSHLAWSAGIHACPAKDVAYLIVQVAIDQLLDALPDLRLAVPAENLIWRPGPFHRALSTLPVTFPKSTPLPYV